MFVARNYKKEKRKKEKKKRKKKKKERKEKEKKEEKIFINSNLNFQALFAGEALALKLAFSGYLLILNLRV